MHAQHSSGEHRSADHAAHEGDLPGTPRRQSGRPGCRPAVSGGGRGIPTTSSERWAAEARQLRTMGALGETTPRGTDRIGPYRKPDFPLHDHAGSSWDVDFTRVEEVGTNYRMNAVQAAVGRG